MCISMLIQFVLITVCISVSGHKLKQVYILSRHHIRTPLSTDLELWTPKQWPVWNGNTGHLTPKGRQLERYMGKYFADWMMEERLFENNCPKDQAFVYANNVQRTKETAKSFVEGAFGDCAGVYFNNDTQTDPVFNLIIKNTSADFRETVQYEIQKKLSAIDMKNAFLELGGIVNFENSSYCKTKNICDLSEAKSEIILEVNKAPDIAGAFRISKTLVDAFLMSFYDGMSENDVAWGEIQTDKQWMTLMSILNTFKELRFQTKILDRDIASNLLEYFTDIFKNGKKKLYLLVGHDSNIHALMSSLRLKKYELHNQYETSPIGGKLVFQKWYDQENDQDLLKVSYVYQSTKQIRDGAEISLQNPPQWETLEIENCAVNKNGFCPWNDFMNVLNT